MSKQGKGARKRAKDRRAGVKRSRKEARQTEWQAAAARGQNRKKNKHQSKSRSGRNQKHAISFCGNLGCKKCFLRYADPAQANPSSCIYARRWSSRKAS